MTVADKVVAFLDNLTRREVEEMSPTKRQKLAELCRHWAAIADPETTRQPKSGVLADLRSGAPRYE
jgi:hypothetical protein